MSGPLDVLREAIDELDAFYVDQADYIAQALAALAAVEQQQRALEWYAERRNYMPPAGTTRAQPAAWIFEQDSFDGEGPGARARAALARFQAGSPADTPRPFIGRLPHVPADTEYEYIEDTAEGRWGVKAPADTKEDA